MGKVMPAICCIWIRHVEPERLTVSFWSPTEDQSHAKVFEEAFRTDDPHEALAMASLQFEDRHPIETGPVARKRAVTH